MVTNNKVRTPLGEGVVQGNFSASDAEPRLLVRMPVNETTKTALRLANCLTPKAAKSGLWIFRVSECGQGLIEILLLLAVVIIATLLLGKCTGLPM